jgi:hypothetical protein
MLNSSYSHSGAQYEYDELFAISFAFVEGDKESRHSRLNWTAYRKNHCSILILTQIMILATTNFKVSATRWVRQ